MMVVATRELGVLYSSVCHQYVSSVVFLLSAWGPASISCHSPPLALAEMLSRSWDARQRPGRVRQEPDIDQRRLDGAMAEPLAQDVQRDAVGQEVSGVAVPEGVAADLAATIEHACAGGLGDRLVDPPRAGRAGCAGQETRYD